MRGHEGAFWAPQVFIRVEMVFIRVEMVFLPEEIVFSPEEIVTTLFRSNTKRSQN